MSCVLHTALLMYVMSDEAGSSFLAFGVLPAEHAITKIGAVSVVVSCDASQVFVPVC